ncbi:elongation factor P 5-aminopentanone reductase [Anaerocolumna chitinilytica]|uniref:3-ketoacyl-ACP reductase n=1 Tax=Anaerocolumna chitinilytica TaxID=1727145 RepID=A0A7M3S9L3_9FIRM|nr:SDR family NAD(P)-dependent oxidoreductase [Anaerocolumna chitinilytica]BCK01281.1 3-ketoacyl-ACP reductase [Anaerocolumna chitinilytica]
MNSKTVLITGASRGIGKAIALRFAKEGFRIAITCKNSKSELLRTKAEIESMGSPCLAYVGDMGSYPAVKELFSLITKTFGSVHILVNNAGISHIGLFTETDPTVWNTIINSNLTSVYNCCHQTVPDMVRAKSGKIINISSVWGVCGASCEVAYSASKGGMNAFTKALAKELAPSNIQVNAIACGAIDTSMNSFLSKADKESLTEEIPANRLGKAEEVAELTWQLAAGNDYLNGQVIALDGAWI